MPLTVVTGPANAEKVGAVLGAYRAALDRDPVLVVPTAADADHYRRELAGDGVVFGSQVLSASRFAGELVRRSGVGGRPLGSLARERVAAAVAGRTPLDALALSARTPGFARALLRLADELAEHRVDPARFAAAMRAWAADEPARAPYASELARLHGALRHALDGLGRPDPVLRAFAALDALRTEPWRWGGAPVFLYGFDDLSALQLDAVATLARHVAADVTVSLTYEPGRVAFAGRGATFQELSALADRHERLEARTEHYARASRAALHHLERSLFELEPPPAFAPGNAVRLLEGGGPRAELELVAADIAALLRDDGLAPEDIAVVLRDPEPAWPLLREVFAACGLSAVLDRRLTAGRTAIGRGVVALVRSAALDGSADDLLAWLRTPGLLERPALADGLEALVRQEGAGSAAVARALWEGRHATFPLTELDRVAEAARRGPAALCERLDAEVARLFAAPWGGSGAVLSGPAELEARVAAALREALGELGALAAADPRLAPDAGALAQILAAVEVRTGAPEPRAIAVTRPQAIRARRVRALFLCGLQEGAFPAPARPEPFLGDAERRAVNRVSALRLPLREDALAVERAFFYAAASRPTDRLTLSWHAADEDGAPQVPSLFLADVRDLFTDELWSRRGQRALGAAGWPDEAPSAAEDRRTRAARGPRAAERPIAPLRHPDVLADLAAARTWSASALEQWASCPVRWFVDRRLAPEALEPDPEAMRRGGLAHAVIEDVLRALHDRGLALTPEHVEHARERLHEALARRADEARISANPERRRSLIRRLEADLLRYLEYAACDDAAYEPAHFEVAFGGDGDELGPAVLAGGDLVLRGRVDRVDREPGGRRAIVVDYKGSQGYAGATWVRDGRLQVGLYMLALEQLLDVEVVGGLYQPLNARDTRPRGALREDADPGRATVNGDRVDGRQLAGLLAAVRDAALRAIEELRRGALDPRPAACAYGGGCQHPSICRGGAA